MTGLCGRSAEQLLPHSLFAATLILFIHVSFAEEISLAVSVKKALALTSDKFLSYTLDPTVILTGDVLTRNFERNVNMARALSPAYLRIGGPRSNTYTFVKSNHSQDNEDSDFTITETNWIDVHRWAEDAGLDILACIASQHTEIGGEDSVWDSKSALDLISFSDRMGFNTSWQLGYECQTRCNIAGSVNGKAVTRLRNMLDAFPRYSKSIVTGPDVIGFRTRPQQQYIQDYLDIAGNALSAITWHPNFSSISLDGQNVSMHHDNLASERDSLYRSIGRPIWKKSLWLAESKPEECKKQFLGALVWTRRLGNAARLGVGVIMRQPDASNLFQPTPDYWVSVLHKSLVGREVLDTKITSGNRSHVNLFCQCTRPSANYERGSLTIFGINLTPNRIFVNLRGLRNETIHRYILMPGYDAKNRMFSETVLLNDEPLNLVNDRELPELKPAISSNGRGGVLKLPSGGIGFWVLPDVKIKACGGFKDDNANKMALKKLSKRFMESDSDRRDVEERNDEKLLKNEQRTKHRLETRLNLDKLEKLLRRRYDYEVEKSSASDPNWHFDFDDKSEAPSLMDDDLDDLSSREIRDKLKEYKKRLMQYEKTIKGIELMSRAKKIDNIDSEETFESAKVIEAMRLLSKMENALDLYEISDDDTNLKSINKNAVNNAGPSNGSSVTDTFLDKLLKSKKIRRVIVPARIEDRLREIYKMLADERERRQRNDEKVEENIGKQDDAVGSTTCNSETSLLRARRQSDKKFGIDPLGLRKEGMYHRSDRIAENTKDRKIWHKGDRKEVHSSVFDSISSIDSDENDFYGFHKSEPIENFPEGDVHLSIGNSNEETLSGCDHLQDNANEERITKKISRTSKKNNRSRVKSESTISGGDDTWFDVRDTHSRHVPKEFFENVKTANTPIMRKDTNEYSELGEAESMSQNHGIPSDVEIDEVATVGKIVRERNQDDQKDKRAKEVAIERLIGYYNNPESRKSIECKRAEDARWTGSEEVASTGLSTIDDAPITKIGQALVKLVTPLMKKKRVKDPTFGESASSTDFRSMQFGKSTVSSAEEQAFAHYDGSDKVASKSKRTKRSINDVLENVLDREMIFQDANNLKDCDCRVTRSTRLPNNSGQARMAQRRINRLRKPLSMARPGLARVGERRKNRKREEGTSSKHVPVLDLNNSQTMRRQKRHVEYPDAKTVGIATGYKVSEAVEYSTMRYKISGPKEYTVPNANGTLLADAYSTITGDRKDENNAKTDLNLDEEMINVTIESKAAGTSVVKRHDKEAMTQVQESLTGEGESQVKNSESSSPSSPKGPSKAKEGKLESTKGSNIQFFRARKNKKESARKLNETEDAKQTRDFDTTVLPPIETTSTTSRILMPRAIAKIAGDKNAPSLASRANIEKTSEKTSGGAEDAAKASTNRKKNRRKLSTLTTKAPSLGGERVKASRLMKNDSASIRKKLLREHTTAKPLNTMKSRSNQQTTPPRQVLTSKRNDDEKKARKLKRTEQLEKLQDKMRQKREKFINSVREATSTELVETTDENENLYRREVIDTTMEQEELGDLVDTAKVEYLKRNKPIDYEATEIPGRVGEADHITKKYVPEKVEIERPPHATRERRVKPQKEIVRAARASNSLAEPKEVSGNKRPERLADDATDHKIARRDGNTYYSFVKSVENPRIVETLSYDEDSGEGVSLEATDDLELEEALMDSSYANGDQRFTHNYDENSEFEDSDELRREDYHTTLDSDEDETRKRQKTQNYKTFIKPRHNNYGFLVKSVEDSTNESDEELLKFVKGNDHSNFASIAGGTAANKRQYGKKKQSTNSKSGRFDRYESLRGGRTMEIDPEDEENSSEYLSAESVDEMESLFVSKKNAKNSRENKLRIPKRTREKVLAKNSATIDYADLDEILNSGKYELLMLVPVDSDQERNRQKRHVGNEIPRDESKSIGSNIVIEMMPKRKMVGKGKMAVMSDTGASIYRMHDAQKIHKSVLGNFFDKQDGNRSTTESESITSVSEPKNSRAKSQKASTEGFETLPKITFDDRENSNNEEGLPDLIEEAVPKIEATVTDGLNKVRRISESFEKFIDGFDGRFNDKQLKLGINRTSSEQNEENNSPITSDLFDAARTSVKKFFDFLSGLVHIFRID